MTDEQRERAAQLLKTIEANLPRWRLHFPNEESEVEIPRVDLLALAAQVKQLEAERDNAQVECAAAEAQVRDQDAAIESLAKRVAQLLATRPSESTGNTTSAAGSGESAGAGDLVAAKCRSRLAPGRVAGLITFSGSE